MFPIFQQFKNTPVYWPQFNGIETMGAHLASNRGETPPTMNEMEKKLEDWVHYYHQIMLAYATLTRLPNPLDDNYIDNSFETIQNKSGLNVIQANGVSCDGRWNSPVKDAKLTEENTITRRNGMGTQNQSFNKTPAKKKINKKMIDTAEFTRRYPESYSQPSYLERDIGINTSMSCSNPFIQHKPTTSMIGTDLLTKHQPVPFFKINPFPERYEHPTGGINDAITGIIPSKNRVNHSFSIPNILGRQEQTNACKKTQNIELERFTCEYCNRSYSTQTGLTRHQLHKHIRDQAPEKHDPCKNSLSNNRPTRTGETKLVKISNKSKNVDISNRIERPYGCHLCNKIYYSMSALKMHVRTHTLPCKCQLCGKAFSRMWLLNGHLRTHTGEKPFACAVCARAFADRSNLRAHMQTHSEIKRYRCLHCSRTFSRMGLLTKHQSSNCTPHSNDSQQTMINDVEDHDDCDEVRSEHTSMSSFKSTFS